MLLKNLILQKSKFLQILRITNSGRIFLLGNNNHKVREVIYKYILFIREKKETECENLHILAEKSKNNMKLSGNSIYTRRYYFLPTVYIYCVWVHFITITHTRKINFIG